MILKVSLRPLDAYFFGGERNMRFDNSSTQRSVRNPYFIRSNKMLSQTAAFGVLRYLGIRDPNPTFGLSSEDKENIGDSSYNLAKPVEIDNLFGKIKAISPVVLEDSNGIYLIPAPRNRCACVSEESTGSFNPFREFMTVRSGINGELRCYPTEYSEKDAGKDPFEFLCDASEGKNELRRAPFSTQVRVGINRAEKKNEKQNLQSVQESLGYFKKEYVLLDSDYRFVFFANVEDDFWYPEKRIVYIGQSRTPFSAVLEVQENGFDAIDFVTFCRPDHIVVDGEEGICKAAICISDFFYKAAGDDCKGVDELVKAASFAIAYPKEYRAFITQYNEKSALKRYKKSPVGMKLIAAGSVFLFVGKDEASVDSKITCFKECIKNNTVQKYAEIAGFNCIHFI